MGMRNGKKIEKNFTNPSQSQVGMSLVQLSRPIKPIYLLKYHLLDQILDLNFNGNITQQLQELKQSYANQYIRNPKKTIQKFTSLEQSQRQQIIRVLQSCILFITLDSYTKIFYQKLLKDFKNVIQNKDKAIQIGDSGNQQSKKPSRKWLQCLFSVFTFSGALQSGSLMSIIDEDEMMLKQKHND